ncbi:hypothetical protein SprV_0200797900 [Sparganum proliferum]
MQCTADLCSYGYPNFELTIGTEGTMIVVQPAPESKAMEPVSHQQTNLRTLECVIPSNIKIDDETVSQTSKVSQAFAAYNTPPGSAPTSSSTQKSNRPERRTTLVERELAHYKVDIAALSETCFAEQRQLEEAGAGYTFFWSDRPKEERRDAGVAFAIQNDIVGGDCPLCCKASTIS